MCIRDRPYLVLTANIFALMGLRQLYFLIGGLLERLVFLSYGLAFLLGFIGVKLILHAMHENELSFINGGQHISWAPDIPIWLSLVVIVGTLAITTVASLVASRHMSDEERDARTGPRRFDRETHEGARSRAQEARASREELSKKLGERD